MKKITFILFSIIFSNILKCQWSTNPSVNNVVCNELNNQFLGDVINDNENSIISVWQDNRNLANSYDIYAQKIDTFGNNIWANNGILVCSAPGSQHTPIIAADNRGGAIVLWSDTRSNITSFQNKNGLYAQRLSKAGTVKWINNGIPIFEDSTYSCSSKFISPSVNETYLVFWTDDRNGYNQIYCQKIDTTGAIYWQTNGVQILNSIGNQYLIDVIDTNGEFIISWSDDNKNIYSQKINSSGLNLWTSNTLAGQNCMNGLVNICSDQRGGIFLSYIKTGGTYPLNCMQRVDDNGLLPWGGNGIIIDTLNNVYVVPKIASDSTDGLFVTWENGTSSNQNIYAQKIDHNGNILWPINGVSICNDLSLQGQPEISIHSDECIITWLDYRLNLGADIYAQKIDLMGNIKWTTNGIVVSNAILNQEGQKTIYNSNYSSVIFWTDGRQDSNHQYQNIDIYCQKVFWNGSLENISKHESLEDNITVFPNPANKEFEIISNKAQSITITDEYGKFIQNINLNSSNNFNIKVTNLQNGIYFISEKNSLGAKKLIVID